MSQSNVTTSTSSKSSHHAMRRILGLGCLLVLLSLSAIPASADVLTSSMKTGLYSVLPNQILSLSVADVATTSEGGTLTLEAYDENGVQLEQLQQSLHAGQALSLQIRGDAYVYDGPTLQVRFVVILSRKTEAGMVPITTLDLINMSNLTTAERLKCTGPAAEEEGPIFNIDCPGVAQSGETTP